VEEVAERGMVKGLRGGGLVGDEDERGLGGEV
jgi:hypothetical protein